MRQQNEQLIEDIYPGLFSPDAQNDFLSQTLSQVRARRRTLSIRKNLTALTACFLLAVVLVKNSIPVQDTTPVRQLAQKSSVNIVETRPFKNIVQSEPQKVAWVDSLPAEMFCRMINDEDLLALLGPRGAMIVRETPSRAQLVFADPENWNGFPLP